MYLSLTWLYGMKSNINLYKFNMPKVNPMKIPSKYKSSLES